MAFKNPFSRNRALSLYGSHGAQTQRYILTSIEPQGFPLHGIDAGKKVALILTHGFHALDKLSSPILPSIRLGNPKLIHVDAAVISDAMASTRNAVLGARHKKHSALLWEILLTLEYVITKYLECGAICLQTNINWRFCGALRGKPPLGDHLACCAAQS